MRLVLVLALGLVAGCSASSSEVDDLPEPFTYAIAMRDCAPWDGAAMTILLTTQPVSDSTGVIDAPHLRLSVWRSPASLGGVSVEWPADKVEAAASWCDNATECEAATSGVVRFREVKTDSVAEGNFWLAFAHRDSSVGGFRAGWLHRQMMCG